jgi:hypothetical protein
MCNGQPYHTHDKATVRVQKLIVDNTCRSCGEPAFVVRTTYRRGLCVWFSFSKCGRCYQ